MPPSAPIGVITLLETALRLVRARLGPLAVLSLLWAAASGGAAALGLDGELALTPSGLAYNGAYALVSGLVSTIGVRVLIETPGRWRVVDPAFLKAVAIYAAVAMAFGVWGVGVAEMLNRPAVPFLGIGMGVVLMVALFVMVKLTLWPVAILVGRRDASLGRAWAMMRGAVVGYIGATLVISVPMVAAMVAGTFAMPADAAARATDAILEVSIVLGSIAGVALAAALYELRWGSRSGLAEVFS